MWLKNPIINRTPVTISRKLSSKQDSKVAFLLFLLHRLTRPMRAIHSAVERQHQPLVHLPLLRHLAIPLLRLPSASPPLDNLLLASHNLLNPCLRSVNRCQVHLAKQRQQLHLLYLGNRSLLQCSVSPRNPLRHSVRQHNRCLPLHNPNKPPHLANLRKHNLP